MIDFNLFLEKIRTLVIIALFSDDYLLNKLVLKGGNALNIIYKLNERSSIDIDVSIEDDFDEIELEKTKDIIFKSLSETFIRDKLIVYDYTFEARPALLDEEYKNFWGGYRVEFKIIPKNIFDSFSGNLESIRRNSLNIGENNSTKFRIDISKYEICSSKIPFELEGYTIYVYTPIMIIYEKLRAICQQDEMYAVRSKRRRRARDFFDIYTIISRTENISQDILLPNNLKILKDMFDIKKVPLTFLGSMEKSREYHGEDFYTLKDTVGKNDELKDFGFYFDFVKVLCDKIIDHLGSINSTL